MDYKSEGYQDVTPYLVVDDVDHLLEFAHKCFGAKENSRMMRSDGTVMHCEWMIGDSMIMVGGSNPQILAYSSNLFIYVKDVDVVYNLAMALGARTIMAPSDQFHGDRMCGFIGPLNNVWYVATKIKDVSDEEAQKLALED